MEENGVVIFEDDCIVTVEFEDGTIVTRHKEKGKVVDDDECVFDFATETECNCKECK